jgi:large subunit ribosomal protein L10
LENSKRKTRRVDALAIRKSEKDMRPEKNLLVEELRSKMDKSKGMLFVRYDKLSPNLSWELATQLSKKEGLFEVVKKRVFFKALEAAGKKATEKPIEGHLGILFMMGDTLDTTKSFFSFSKSNEEIFHVEGGEIEGRFYTANEIEAISKLPSLNEIRAQFLGLLEAPMAETLSVMESLLTSVMHCIENKSQQETKNQ